MKKHFIENKTTYTIIFTQEAGGRVAGTLWTETIELTKEFTLISFVHSTSRVATSNKLTYKVDQTQVDKAIKYAKGQVKKINSIQKTVKILVNDVYGYGICVKEVDLTASGTPSLKQAGSRVSSSDIKPYTDKIQTEINNTKSLSNNVQKLREELRLAENKLRLELTKIWDEN